MGEYYLWVNIDKKEYIDPVDFDYGCKSHESMHKDSIPLHALHSLLANLWKGDRVLWLGDECSVSAEYPNDIIKCLYAQSADFGYPGNAYDMICESYMNVSGLFKEAEKVVREEIGYYLEEYEETGSFNHVNAYGIDLDDPYNGLFLISGRRYLYTINYTKKFIIRLMKQISFFRITQRMIILIHCLF